MDFCFQNYLGIRYKLHYIYQTHFVHAKWVFLHCTASNVSKHCADHQVPLEFFSRQRKNHNYPHQCKLTNSVIQYLLLWKLKALQKAV